jgi:hypothetical protein
VGYLLEGLELLIRKVAYTTNDATSLVRWSNYRWDITTLSRYSGPVVQTNQSVRYQCRTDFQLRRVTGLTIHERAQGQAFRFLQVTVPIKLPQHSVTVN